MDILLKRGYLIYIMFVHVMEHIGCTRTYAYYKNKFYKHSYLNLPIPNCI